MMNPKIKYGIIATVGIILIISFIKRRRIMTYVLSKQNAPFIAQLNNDVQYKFKQLIMEAEKLGWNFYITSALRVQTKNSMHQLGLAIDCNLVNAETGKYVNMKDSSIEDWLKTGVPQLAEKLGFTWGGRFLTYTNMYGKKGDAVHFEYNFGKTYAQLIEIGVKQFGSKENALKNYKQIKFA